MGLFSPTDWDSVPVFSMYTLDLQLKLWPVSLMKAVVEAFPSRGHAWFGPSCSNQHILNTRVMVRRDGAALTGYQFNGLVFLEMIPFWSQQASWVADVLLPRICRGGKLFVLCGDKARENAVRSQTRQWVQHAKASALLAQRSPPPDPVFSPAQRRMACALGASEDWDDDSSQGGLAGPDTAGARLDSPVRGRGSRVASESLPGGLLTKKPKWTQDFDLAVQKIVDGAFSEEQPIVLFCPDCKNIEEQRPPYILPYCLCKIDGGYGEMLGSMDVSLMLKIEEPALLAVYRLGGKRALVELLGGDD